MTYSPRGVMQKAWCLARAGARRFGGRSRPYLAEALRQAWAEAKAIATRNAGQRARVQASIDSLAADTAAAEASWRTACAMIGETAEERFERRRAEREAAAKVVPFPARPASPSPVPLRRVA